MEPSAIATVEPAPSCLLADDNKPVLDALASLLRGEGLDVVGTAGTGLEALRLLRRRLATTIVLDVRLPDLDGLEVARRASEIVRSSTSIIFYTSYADPGFVVEALDVGARAVVLKDAPPRNLLEAIHEVSQGRLFIDPHLRAGPRRSCS